MRKSLIIMLLLSVATFVSCSKSKDLREDNPNEKIPISLSTSICTKATETNFESNDRIGLFVVNFNNGVPGKLATAGNHVDNEVFTFNGSSWISSNELYWKDGVTHADFYCYYPHSNAISDVGAVPFAVCADQTSMESIKSSDFLWGKTEDAFPSERPVEITAYHRVSKVVVRIMPGKGYTKEILASKEIQVSLCGFYTNATVNLADGSVTPSGSRSDMSLYRSDDCWYGYVIPQSFTDSNVVKVVLDGNEYFLKQTVSFGANKSQECTLTINRIEEGVNIGIGGWDNDGTDFGGTLN